MTYALSYDTRFLNDGWNLVADYNAAGSSVTAAHTYLWGLDLSGSPQCAGGGLPSETNGGGVYFPTHDGNGNVVGLVDSADGALAAEFVYAPFGRPLKSLGTVVETGLAYQKWCFGRRLLFWRTLSPRWYDRWSQRRNHWVAGESFSF